MQTRRLATSFETFTRFVEHTGPEKYRAKPRVFRRFFSENPRNQADAKELIALLKTWSKSARGYYHVSSRSMIKITKRFEEICSINAAIFYGYKMNSLLLICLCLVYYMRLMLGRISVLLNCLFQCSMHVEHKGNHEKLPDHTKIAIFVSQ